MSGTSPHNHRKHTSDESTYLVVSLHLQIKVELTTKQKMDIKDAFDLFDADGSESIDANVRVTKTSSQYD